MNSTAIEVLDIPKGQRIDGFPFEPFGGLLVCEPFEHDQTDEGLFLPRIEGAYIRGRVVAFGPGTVHGGKLIPVGVELGDYIRMPASNKTEISINGKPYYLIAAAHIIGRDDGLPKGWVSTHAQPDDVARLLRAKISAK